MTYYWPCNSRNEWTCDAILLFLGIPEGLTYYWPFTLAAILICILAVFRRCDREKAQT